MSREKNNKPSGVIAGIVLALFIIWGSYEISNMYYFLPAQEELVKQQLKLDELKSSNDENEKIKANADQLEKSLTEVEEQFKSLKSLVPLEAELPIIGQKLEEKATERALGFKFFSQSSKTSKIGSLNEVPFQVDVSGDYDGIGRYIEDFARFERLLKVNSVVMKLETTNGTPTGKMYASIYASAYLTQDKADKKDKTK
ncbi:MAG: type 4a pilus biogenesis protein PilO [Blastocatellia bacterium]